ncbi:MAG: NADPH:quinone oxidoreductase family protein [Myxococcota bacterium]
MRAVVARAHGPPEKLEIAELPTPELRDGEVRVDVHAAAVGFPDLLVLEDRYQISVTPPFVPGSEFAGVVSELGAGVEGLRPGDRVLGAVLVGAFAEEIVAPAQSLRRVPDGIDLGSAAAFWVAYVTAWTALRSLAGLEAGETLVVLGAAGGVGLAAVELGKLRGAKVIAAASSPAKLRVCREHGADETIDYQTEDLRERIRTLTYGRGADVVLDPVGGAWTEAALRGLGFGGRLVVVGFASGEIPRVPTNRLLLRGTALLGLEIGSFLARRPREAGENERELLARLGDGRLRPHVSARYPLEETAAALRHVAERRAIGRVLIEPRPSRDRKGP